MNHHGLRYMIPMLLAVLTLAACQNQGPIREGATRTPIRETLRDLANDDVTLAVAFVESPLYDRLRVEDYPVTIFFMTDEDFDAYLSEKGLTKESFLASGKLDSFLESFIIEGVSLPGNEEETYMTEAGDTVTISDVSEPGLDGGLELNINGSPARCRIYVPEGKVGSICNIKEPLVDFSW